MSDIGAILARMRENPKGMRFTDLARVCEHFFGPARTTKGSHRVYRTPWQGDPRVNIQNHRGQAKAYQVRQVLAAVARLEEAHHNEDAT